MDVVLRENRMEDFGSVLRGVAQTDSKTKGGWGGVEGGAETLFHKQIEP